MVIEMVSAGNKKFNRKMQLLEMCLKGATIQEMKEVAERYVTKPTAERYVNEVIEFVQKQHQKNQGIKHAK